MGKLLQRHRERKANKDVSSDLHNAAITNPESATAGLGSYDALLEAAQARNLDAGMTPKEAKNAAQDEIRGVVREAQALDQGATPEAAARERERAQSNDFRGGIQRNRDEKKEKAALLRAEAEESMQSNVDLAQGLVDRDLGTSALSGLTADPLMQAAQQDALSRYGDISREGFTGLDRQALDQSFMQSRQEEQAQREAVMADAQRRGDTGGGSQLLGSLMAQQGGANRAAQFSTDVGLAGRDRALQGLGAYAGMAGDMRTQGVNEQIARGGAVDQFNQWATGQRSADTGTLIGQQGAQTQYNLIRAGELKPKNAQQIVGGVVQFVQDTGQMVSQMVPQNSGASAQGAAQNPFASAAKPTTKSRRSGGGFGGAYG